jgi:methyl-accepting chemotaxis protein
MNIAHNLSENKGAMRMKPSLHSISTKLIFGGIVAVLLPLIIAGWISYTKSHKALTEMAKNQAEEIALDLARTTRYVVESEILKATAMSNQKRIVELGEAVDNFGIEANELMIGDMFADLSRQFLGMGKHYQGIFLADSNGKLYTGILDSGKEYKGSDISGRDYFKKAKQEQKTVLSDIVISKSTGNPIVVVCAPIQSTAGKFIGVFGLVMKAAYFTDIISSRKIGETGYGYMIDQKGLIIAHPKPELFLKLNVTTIEAMQPINQKMIAGQSA